MLKFIIQCDVKMEINENYGSKLVCGIKMKIDKS